MPFLVDVFWVAWTILGAVVRWIMTLGFATQKIVILRETPVAVRVMTPVDAVLARAHQALEERRPPIRFDIPGWSRLTRIGYETEHAVEFKWL